MSIIDAIIKANKEGRKVIWPGTESMTAHKPMQKPIQLLDVADGIHPYHSQKYERSVYSAADIDYDDMEECIRCGELDFLSYNEYCEHCHDDMLTPWPKTNSAEDYIEKAQPVFPYKKK